MTEITVRTDDSPPVADEIIHEVVANHDDRLTELETGEVTDKVADSVRYDELSTRLRDLETRYEMGMTSSGNDAPPEEPEITVPVEPEQPPADEPGTTGLPDPDKTVEEETEDVEEEFPEIETEDDPDTVIPSDPTERPELNPQGEITEIEREVKTPEVEKKTTVRKRPAAEKKPKQERGFASFILGGSGGMKRNRRKAKSK